MVDSFFVHCTALCMCVSPKEEDDVKKEREKEREKKEKGGLFVLSSSVLCVHTMSQTKTFN